MRNPNDTQSPRQASLTGVNYGLTVEMFLDQDNYMLKKLSKNAGARVVVHDPYSIPLPDEFGINLQPNTATGVAVQKVRRLQTCWAAKFYCLSLFFERDPF